MKTKSILVLFSRKNHKKTAYERIFSILKNTAMQQGYRFNLECSTLDELWIEVNENKLSITDSVSGKNLKDFDFVHFNWWGRAKRYALACATYLKRQNVPFLTENIANFEAESKIGEMALMADCGIPLPKTFISSNSQLANVFRTEPPIEFPLIMKSADACGGRDNYLLQDYNEMVEVLGVNQQIDFLVQEYIPNDCDYRCLVVGGEIKLVIRRYRSDDATTHVNNTSSGGTGEVVPVESIDQSFQKIVLDAAIALGREQFSGVDLIINKNTGEPYILEVNQNPEIEEGAEPDKKMAALFGYIDKVSL